MRKLAIKWSVFEQQHRKISTKYAVIILKVACVHSLIIASDVMKNYADLYALCFSRPVKFKLINIG